MQSYWWMRWRPSWLKYKLLAPEKKGHWTVRSMAMRSEKISIICKGVQTESSNTFDDVLGSREESWDCGNEREQQRRQSVSTAIWLTHLRSKHRYTEMLLRFWWLRTRTVEIEAINRGGRMSAWDMKSKNGRRFLFPVSKCNWGWPYVSEGRELGLENKQQSVSKQWDPVNDLKYQATLRFWRLRAGSIRRLHDSREMRGNEKECNDLQGVLEFESRCKSKDTISLQLEIHHHDSWIISSRYLHSPSMMVLMKASDMRWR